MTEIKLFINPYAFYGRFKLSNHIGKIRSRDTLYCLKKAGN